MLLLATLGHLAEVAVLLQTNQEEVVADSYQTNH
jgi:hypothetical protein